MDNLKQVATFYYYLSTAGRSSLGAQDVADALKSLDDVGKVVVDIVVVPGDGGVNGAFFKVANT